jgi:hypothetical protein
MIVQRTVIDFADVQIPRQAQACAGRQFDKAKIASIIRIFRDKRKHAQASWHFDKANIASHFAHS